MEVKSTHLLNARHLRFEQRALVVQIRRRNLAVLETVLHLSTRAGAPRSPAARVSGPLGVVYMQRRISSEDTWVWPWPQPRMM